MKPDVSQQIFEKFLNIKFHDKRSSGSRVVPCGGKDRRTDGQTKRRRDGLIERQTNMTKLIVFFFFFFSKVLKNTNIVIIRLKISRAFPVFFTIIVSIPLFSAFISHVMTQHKK
jgi:hypothetical protein